MIEKKINTSESSDSISEEEMLRRLGITENNLAGFNDLKVVPDPDEGGFVVSYPDLPGCITCGDTIESAIANARDAKAEWLAAASEEGINNQLPSRNKLDHRPSNMFPAQPHKAERGFFTLRICPYQPDLQAVYTDSRRSRSR